jgi:hypothetical protein
MRARFPRLAAVLADSFILEFTDGCWHFSRTSLPRRRRAVAAANCTRVACACGCSGYVPSESRNPPATIAGLRSHIGSLMKAAARWQPGGIQRATRSDAAVSSEQVFAPDRVSSQSTSVIAHSAGFGGRSRLLLGKRLQCRHPNRLACVSQGSSQLEHLVVVQRACVNLRSLAGDGVVARSKSAAWSKRRVRAVAMRLSASTASRRRLHGEHAP